jgi:hypothetical protein
MSLSSSMPTMVLAGVSVGAPAPLASRGSRAAPRIRVAMIAALATAPALLFTEHRLPPRASMPREPPAPPPAVESVASQPMVEKPIVAPAPANESPVEPAIEPPPSSPARVQKKKRSEPKPIEPKRIPKRARRPRPREKEPPPAKASEGVPMIRVYD